MHPSYGLFELAKLCRQDALAKNALAILQARVQGENSLFDILQEVATRILLEVLVGSSLPAGWILDKT